MFVRLTISTKLAALGSSLAEDVTFVVPIHTNRGLEVEADFVVEAVVVLAFQKTAEHWHRENKQGKYL
ncbi:hypothetical protein DPMN_114922 [Dreissena polymorpha]|uniref:Uncharacterized protein n=1 Tax=Dreissena polymorpha TaxID=45954 RepID=A0A9D4KKZ6_DREPO|nr:hypothetical protein DPMN_114922 [Dreissena polymorpha]